MSTCKNTDSVTSRLTDVRRLRPRLAMLAFRCKIAAQTRIRLRLSHPNATPSSWCGFPTKNKPRLRGGIFFGRDRIRTYVGRSPTVLQTVAFDHSATLPIKIKGFYDGVKITSYLL